MGKNYTHVIRQAKSFFSQLSTFLQDLFLLQSKGRKVSCNLDKTIGGFLPNEPVVSFFFWIRLLVLVILLCM